MKYYNLYYKDTKINNRPINETELSEILKEKELIKKNSITNKFEYISVNDIKVTKTIII